LAVTHKYAQVKLTDIRVDRAARQRTDRGEDGKLDVSDIIESIRARGVLSPILLHRESDGSTPPYTLVYGERRFTAATECHHITIPARIAQDLDAIELQIIELEENLKRKDLGWLDHVKAVAKIHSLWLTQNPDHTQTESAKRLGYTAAMMSMFVQVYNNLDDPKVAGASHVGAAYNIIYRKDARAQADLMADLIDSAVALVSKPKPAAAPAPGEPPAPKPEPVSFVKSAHEDILHENFLQWAPNYRGSRFNLIHCDFPYGINFNAGPQSGARKWTTYKDSPDIYWALVMCLCENLDKLMSVSGHLMFWLSADVEIQHDTIQCFAKHASSLAFHSKPLIWLKSDNAGIIRDAKREPRHIYETCLIASRDDRFIIRSVSDAYAAPTNKEHHPSTKPEPVLRNFMQMFVDQNTRMLDPTCGSGSSLRAAESLGATKVLGLEISDEHCANARSALRQFRSLRSASK